MADLTKSRDDAATSTCCAPERQADCCEPTDKAECCSAESSSCGCSAGQSEGEEIREAVRSRYAAAAESVAGEDEREQALRDAGLVDIEIVETHRVHDRAGSAIVRARKPS